ncbi:MAG: tetratricopeptide repeat protein [Bernardetiaceae bacterium]|nr:tetratricopeptide repeat protein [Bernardetiaceae bacterium]
MHFLYYLFFLAVFALFGITPAQSQNVFYTPDGKKLTVEKCIEASEERKAQGDYRGASDFLNKAALIHWERKEYREAIDFFQRSLELNQRLSNQSGIYGIYSNLGTIYADLEKYDSAYYYFERTLEGRRKSGQKPTIISALINSSVVLNNLKRYNESAVLLTEALDLAKETNDIDQMKSCYGMLAETYEKAGDTQKTRYYFDMYRGFHELSQRNRVVEAKNEAEEQRLRAALLEAEKEKAQLEIELKEKEIKKERAKVEAKNDTLAELEKNFSKQELALRVMEQQSALREAEFEREKAAREEKIIRQKLWIVLTSGLLALVFVIALFIYRSRQQKKQANIELRQKSYEISQQQNRIVVQNKKIEKAFSEIEQKNKNITASINYAQRIQAAMLPDRRLIAQTLPQSFIFFKPRDIVSGDFYFFHEVDNKVILAAVDCTGHGVPGAFMSLIGNEVLSRIVKEQKITEPDKILNQLDQGIRNALHQEQTHNRDGMDMSLVTLDKERNILQFAGAKNPLYYFENQELKVIKGDKMSIGGDFHKSRSNFKLHEINSQNIESFYLFSDGFQDQFGGEEGRKFMVGRFKRLLASLQDKSIESQTQTVEQTFQDWIGEDYEQVDDVLLLGVKMQIKN